MIDLSALNRLIVLPRFRMETARALRRSVRPFGFAVSIDLSDAYLHVPMHLSTRRYLRFAIDGEIFAFTALPFGLNISPWVFTRLMDVVVSHLRQITSADVSNYLDDCLQKSLDPLSLQQDLQFFFSSWSPWASWSIGRSLPFSLRRTSFTWACTSTLLLPWCFLQPREFRS